MREHDNESARAARAAHASLMSDPSWARWYVYFKTGRIEALREDADTSGWTLAWPEHVPTNITADQMVLYFRSRTGKLPYLPVGEFHAGSGR